MTKKLIHIFSWIHNFSYRAIGVLALRAHDGIHPKHRILNYYQFFLDHMSPGARILDIGCGNGALAYHVAAKAGSVTAIDIVPKSIAFAKKRFTKPNITYIVGDATTYQFSEQFDAIMLSNVLEHIEQRTVFLQSIKTLAPVMLIRVPLLTRDWLSVYKKENGWEYRLDNTHCIEYTEENFQEEMLAAGLTVESTYVKFGELYAIVAVTTK